MKVKETIVKSFTDYCEISQEEREINIYYGEVSILGTLSKEYKRNDFDCDIGEETDCKYYKTPHCPIYNKAPITVKD